MAIPSPAEKRNIEKLKPLKNGFHVFWDIGFIGFIKPPIEGDRLPEETHRDHYSFH